MESFSVKTKTGDPVSRVTRRPGIPSPLITLYKAADSLRWFSRPKPRLIQSRLAVNSPVHIISIPMFVNRGKSAQTADPSPSALTPGWDGR